MISVMNAHDYLSPDSFAVIMLLVLKLRSCTTYHWLLTTQLMNANWLIGNKASWQRSEEVSAR